MTASPRAVLSTRVGSVLPPTPPRPTPPPPSPPPPSAARTAASDETVWNETKATAEHHWMQFCSTSAYKATMQMTFPLHRTVLWDHSTNGDGFEITLCTEGITVTITEQALYLAAANLDAPHDNSLFLVGHLDASTVGGSGPSSVTVHLDRFERRKLASHDDSVMQTACIPGNIQVPVTIHNRGLANAGGQKQPVPFKQHLEASLVALKARARSHQRIDLPKYFPLRSYVFVDSQADTLAATVVFDLCTYSTKFGAKPINCVPITLTALSKSLASARPLSQPQTGYLTMDDTRKLVLILDCDPKALTMPLVGIWVSGIDCPTHPFVWAACSRYAYDANIADRVCQGLQPFLLVLYSSAGCRPQFYDILPKEEANDNAVSMTALSEPSYKLLTAGQTYSMAKVNPNRRSRVLQCCLHTFYDKADVTTDDQAPEAFALGRRCALTTFCQTMNAERTRTAVSQSLEDGNIDGESSQEYLSDVGRSADDSLPRDIPSPHEPQAQTALPSVPDVSLLMTDSAAPVEQPQESSWLHSSRTAERNDAVELATGVQQEARAAGLESSAQASPAADVDSAAVVPASTTVATRLVHAGGMPAATAAAAASATACRRPAESSKSSRRSLRRSPGHGSKARTVTSAADQNVPRQASAAAVGSAVQATPRLLHSASATKKCDGRQRSADEKHRRPIRPMPPSPLKLPLSSPAPESRLKKEKQHSEHSVQSAVGRAAAEGNLASNRSSSSRGRLSPLCDTVTRGCSPYEVAALRWEAAARAWLLPEHLVTGGKLARRTDEPPSRAAGCDGAAAVATRISAASAGLLASSDDLRCCSCPHGIAQYGCRAAKLQARRCDPGDTAVCTRTAATTAATMQCHFCCCCRCCEHRSSEHAAGAAQSSASFFDLALSGCLATPATATHSASFAASPSSLHSCRPCAGVLSRSPTGAECLPCNGCSADLLPVGQLKCAAAQRSSPGAASTAAAAAAAADVAVCTPAATNVHQPQLLEENWSELPVYDLLRKQDAQLRQLQEQLRVLMLSAAASSPSSGCFRPAASRAAAVGDGSSSPATVAHHCTRSSSSASPRPTSSCSCSASFAHSATSATALAALRSSCRRSKENFVESLRYDEKAGDGQQRRNALNADLQYLEDGSIDRGQAQMVRGRRGSGGVRSSGDSSCGSRSSGNSSSTGEYDSSLPMPQLQEPTQSFLSSDIAVEMSSYRSSFSRESSSDGSHGSRGSRNKKKRTMQACGEEGGCPSPSSSCHCCPPPHGGPSCGHDVSTLRQSYQMSPTETCIRNFQDNKDFDSKTMEREASRLGAGASSVFTLPDFVLRTHGAALPDVFRMGIDLAEAPTRDNPCPATDRTVGYPQMSAGIVTLNYDRNSLSMASTVETHASDKSLEMNVLAAKYLRSGDWISPSVSSVLDGHGDQGKTATTEPLHECNSNNTKLVDPSTDQAAELSIVAAAVFQDARCSKNVDITENKENFCSCSAKVLPLPVLQACERQLSCSRVKKDDEENVASLDRHDMVESSAVHCDAIDAEAVASRGKPGQLDKPLSVSVSQSDELPCKILDITRLRNLPKLL